MLYNKSIIDKMLADDFKAKQQLPGLSALNLFNQERLLFSAEDIARAVR